MESINLTTILASAITAGIVSISNYIAIRYVSRLIDHLEHAIKGNGKQKIWWGRNLIILA